MKSVSAVILSFIVFLASFQGSLILVDYQMNKDYYEAICTNKDKPEMQCNGKCQIKKQAERNAPQTELVKLSFEFNIVPTKNIEVPTPKIQFSEILKPTFYFSTENILKGFYKILPHPPQNLV